MKVTKFKSQNLLGETRKQEEKRLLDQKVKSILKGKDKGFVKEIKRGGKNYLMGTTSYQRKLRNKLRKEVGLKGGKK